MSTSDSDTDADDTMSAGPIIPVSEYPLPFDRDEIIEMQEEQVGEPYGLPFEEDVVRSVDEFHDKYIQELTRTDEWVFFRNHWSASQYIYVWNHMGGYGFKFDADWEIACSLIDAWDQFTEEHDASDFEPAHYPWQLP